MAGPCLEDRYRLVTPGERNARPVAGRAATELEIF